MGAFLSKICLASKDGTAQGLAKYRFMELIQPDKDKRLFEDPYAFGFVIGSSLINWIGYEYCHRKSDKMASGMWESLICRQLFIDRQITKAIEEESVTQIVILGAGYDNRFYRLSCIRDKKSDSNLTLIEVDQPEVQKLKKNGLKCMGIIGKHNTNDNDGSALKMDEVESYAFTNQEIDEEVIEFGKSCKVDLSDMEKGGSDNKLCVHYCPCNFETMNFKDQIMKAKFDPSKKTVFVIEGLTQYVDKSALKETINTLDKLCTTTGSKIVITYVDSRVFDEERMGEICGDGGTQMKGVLKLLVQVNEPWISSFDVDEGSGKFEMQDWIYKNTSGNFSEDYIDQSWDEFCENDLVPKARNVYQFGQKAGEVIPKWAVERHACVTRI